LFWNNEDNNSNIQPKIDFDNEMIFLVKKLSEATDDLLSIKLNDLKIDEFSN